MKNSRKEKIKSKVILSDLFENISLSHYLLLLAQSFVDQLNMMRKSENFDLNAYKSIMEETTSGWKAKLPGMSSVPGMKETKTALKIMQAIEVS